MNLEFKVHYFNLIFFLLLGFLLHLLLRAGRRYILFMVIESKRSKLAQWLNVVEGLVWISYAIAGIQAVFQNRAVSFFSLILICLVTMAWFSWFAVKDLVAGIILKYQKAFELDQRIKIENIDGRIKRLGYLSLSMESYQGELVDIPYSRVFSTIRIKPNQEEIIKSQRLVIEVPKRKRLPDTLERLSQIVLFAPWSSIVKKPLIQLIEEKEQSYTFEIIAYSLHSDYFQKIRAFLIEKMSEPF